MVTDLIRATPEEDVIRRDIYDRPPIFKWTEVRSYNISPTNFACHRGIGPEEGVICCDIHDCCPSSDRLKCTVVSVRSSFPFMATCHQPVDVYGVNHVCILLMTWVKM